MHPAEKDAAQHITNWLFELRSRGLFTEGDLEELEDDLRLRLDFHLEREENLPAAFEAATAELGQPDNLARAYRQINRSRPWIEGALFMLLGTGVPMLLIVIAHMLQTSILLGSYNWGFRGDALTLVTGMANGITILALLTVYTSVLLQPKKIIRLLLSFTSRCKVLTVTAPFLFVGLAFGWVALLHGPLESLYAAAREELTGQWLTSAFFEVNQWSLYAAMAIAATILIKCKFQCENTTWPFRQLLFFAGFPIYLNIWYLGFPLFFQMAYGLFLCVSLLWAPYQLWRTGRERLLLT